MRYVWPEINLRSLEAVRRESQKAELMCQHIRTPALLISVPLFEACLSSGTPKKGGLVG